jgi:hypothetical protein
MPTPNIYVKVGLAIALICAIFGGGFYVEHLRFVKYQVEVEVAAKAQEAHNKDLIKQQQLIAQKVQNDYEDKIARINKYYSDQLRHTSSSKLPSTRTSSIGIATTSTQPLLDCARTTEQLEALQDWVRENTKAK